MTDQPTITDVLEAIREYSSDVDKRFQKVIIEIDGMKSDLVTIKSTMATKNDLSYQIADLKGDILVAMHKQDKKTDRLIDRLAHRRVITAKESQEIRAKGPFQNPAPRGQDVQ